MILADIRQSCAIQSATFGSIMTVPREGRLVRIYVHMKEFSRGGIFKRSQISPAMMLEAAKNIMAPFTLRFNYCEWWSVYQVSFHTSWAFRNFLIFQGRAAGGTKIRRR